MSTRLVALGLALAVFAPLPASASPPDLFGYGGRTPGLAMTGTSYAEGHEATYANPAGLSRTRRYGLFLGLQAGAYRLSLDDVSSPVDPARGITIGFQVPLPFGDVLEDRLTLGGAFVTPSGALLRGEVVFAGVPQFTVLDRAEAVVIQLGLGIDLREITPGLSLGVGVAGLADVFGALDVALDETATFQAVIETQLVATFAPVVGLQWRNDELGFGLKYQHELAARFQLDIRTADLPVEVPVLTVGGVAQYDPPTLAAEGHWRPVPELMLVAHLTTRFWGAYPGGQIPTTESSFLAPDPSFDTTLSPRVAAEWTHDDRDFAVQLRGGYAFEPTPAPPADERPLRTSEGEVATTSGGDPRLTALRILDNNRHVLTLGAGLGVDVDNLRLQFDLYGQAHLLRSRTHAIAQASGDAPMQTSGAIWVGGFTVGLEYDR